MFRLIRLVVMLCATFGAGYIYAEITARERCDASGGTWDSGICRP